MPATPAHIGPAVLRTLHRIHRQLTDLKERLDRGPKHIRAAEANIEHREELLSQVKAEAKNLRMAADQKQLQLKSHEDKVQELRRKLNAASSNREYQALLEQIAADEMANSVLTDEILEALEKIDAFQKDIAEAEAGLAAAKRKADEIRGKRPSRSRRSWPTSRGSKRSCSNPRPRCPPRPARCTAASCDRGAKTRWPWSKTSTAAAAINKSN